MTAVSDPDVYEPGFFNNYMAIPDNKGNLVYVPKGTGTEVLKELQGKRFSFPYSPLLADMICALVCDGEFLTNICKRQNMPTYSQLAKWRREHPEFDKSYRNAVRDRAETMLAKLVAEVEQAGVDRDEIALAKLKSDVYKYVAKVGDPDSFTEKQQIKAEVALATYTIETGIRRPGDPGYNRDETRLVGGEDE